MKKSLLAMVVVAFALGACSKFQDSPEQVQFRAFLEHCKAAPTTAECKAYADLKKDAGGPN
jgi:hypothetical protein